MKFIIQMMIMLGLAVTALAKDTNPTPKGDDLFPWPGASICPFPWQEIQGSYIVKSKNSGLHVGHFLLFQVVLEQKSGSNRLRIEEYDNKGYLLASGFGESKGDTRMVKGVLKPTRGGREYEVQVRSYTRETAMRGRCVNENSATVITFCPLKGRKCRSELNYVLEKLNL